MTMYSILRTQRKITVTAVWAGQWADSHSTNVASFDDPQVATDLADALTRVSESMWDAAAWLDIYVDAETKLTDLVAQLRTTDPISAPVLVSMVGSRHTDTMTAFELTNTLEQPLPKVLNSLTRSQRLSVADELETDSAARAESRKLLPTGYDPVEPESRVWQAVSVTRVLQLGLPGSLPDGAAGWSARLFDVDRGPAQRWGARNLLHRVEQLDAATTGTPIRAVVELETTGPRQVGNHLVFPAATFGIEVSRRGTQHAQVQIADKANPEVADSALADAFRRHAATLAAKPGAAVWVDDAIVSVAPPAHLWKVAPWDRDVFAEVEVIVRLGDENGSQTHVLATLDPADSDGFAATLGSWVGSVRFRA